VWFLDVLGVTPSSQGQGLGSALVRHGLALADADGVAALLETGNPDNIGYYRQFGFEVWRQEAAPDGGPVVSFMIHRPD
jgi:predicted N-acetyltransferase YhbS